MTEASDILDALEERLAETSMDVERNDDRFVVMHGRSVMATEATIDPAKLVGHVHELEGPALKRAVAAFANGVFLVMLEPKRSDAGDWTFVEAAGSIVPSVEGPAFRLGVEAAAGSPAWTLEFFDGLELAYLLELDQGMRPLTEAQVESWSATRDRITAAGRSILFHKTRNATPSPLESHPSVEQMSVGDDLDAARSLVVADVFFSEFDDDYRFAIPERGRFLFVRESSQDALNGLRAAVDDFFERSDYPLTRSIFGFEAGKPVLIEPRE